MIAEDLVLARLRMVHKEVERKGITDPRVLGAMKAVPRHRFVPPALEKEAYSGSALPIGLGQTISAPQIVGLMSQALGLVGDERILEVGTGSGYQAAVLAALVRRVISIERHPDLARRARALLADLKIEGVTILVGDGTLGHAAEAPYNGILVTAATPQVPPPLFDQLADGGTLVAPVGSLEEQDLVRYTKGGCQVRKEVLCKCVFVPLVGEAGFEERS